MQAIKLFFVWTPRVLSGSGMILCHLAMSRACTVRRESTSDGSDDPIVHAYVAERGGGAALSPGI